VSAAHVARYAFINAAAATADQQVVAAVAGKRIKVMGVVLTAGSAAGTILFESGTSTAISATFNLAANGGLAFGFNLDGWFETRVGEALTVTTAGAGATFAVQVQYVVY
jgi:hypothetical protein